MDLFILILFVCSIVEFDNGVTEANRILLKDEDLKFDRQLKLLNKPAIKTLKTEDGGLYDCVDFFKQPAFDHPLLKNTSDFQVLPPSILTIINNHQYGTSKGDNIGPNDLECPIGTVPIRRVTKAYSMNDQKLAAKASVSNSNPVHYAVAKTKAGTYSGAGADLSIQNPKASGAQYSAARIRVINGPDVIQAGWRVDPGLYGDTNTRFFIHTDAGQTHCFNTFCSGFVLVRHDFFLGGTLRLVTVLGYLPHMIKVSIKRDEYGNWNLYVGVNSLFVGYWPSRLFSGLSGLASFLDWGGEVSAPPGTPFPPMGSGEAHPRNYTQYDAFFGQVSTYNEMGQITNADDLAVEKDTKMYFVYDKHYVDDSFKHLVIYGGAGGV